MAESNNKQKRGVLIGVVLILFILMVVIFTIFVRSEFQHKITLYDAMENTISDTPMYLDTLFAFSRDSENTKGINVKVHALNSTTVTAHLVNGEQHKQCVGDFEYMGTKTSFYVDLSPTKAELAIPEYSENKFIYTAGTHGILDKLVIGGTETIDKLLSGLFTSSANQGIRARDIVNWYRDVFEGTTQKSIPGKDVACDGKTIKTKGYEVQITKKKWQEFSKEISRIYPLEVPENPENFTFRFYVNDKKVILMEIEINDKTASVAWLGEKCVWDHIFIHNFSENEKEIHIRTVRTENNEKTEITYGQEKVCDFSVEEEVGNVSYEQIPGKEFKLDEMSYENLFVVYELIEAVRSNLEGKIGQE